MHARTTGKDEFTVHPNSSLKFSKLKFKGINLRSKLLTKRGYKFNFLNVSNFQYSLGFREIGSFTCKVYKLLRAFCGKHLNNSCQIFTCIKYSDSHDLNFL